MKQLIILLAFAFLSAPSAVASHLKAEKPQSAGHLADSEIGKMHKDVHLVLSKYSRIQARDTRYTVNILSSRMYFDSKVILYDYNREHGKEAENAESLFDTINE